MKIFKKKKKPVVYPLHTKVIVDGRSDIIYRVICHYHDYSTWNIFLNDIFNRPFPVREYSLRREVDNAFKFNPSFRVDCDRVKSLFDPVQYYKDQPGDEDDDI